MKQKLAKKSQTKNPRFPSLDIEKSKTNGKALEGICINLTYSEMKNACRKNAISTIKRVQFPCKV